MFLTILVGLFPTVMLLSLFLTPFTKAYGLTISILLGNIASVSFLEWVGTPFLLNPLLGNWLCSNGPGRTGRDRAGAALIVLAVIVMLFSFRLITG
jgi:antibiotic biosynthesis monooxygenase (ABM) superfamily enzyme